MTQELLFDPQSGAPIRGMLSAVNPAATPPGYVPQLTNWRLDKATLRARYGAYKLTSAVPEASASFRGLWEGEQDGTYRAVAAYRVGSATNLYSLNVSTFGWTKQSLTGGVYGNTYFPTDGPVSFAIAQDPVNGVDVLVANNGYDEPLIFDPAYGGANLSIHHEIAPPTATALQRAHLKWPVFVQIYETGTPSNTVSDSDATKMDRAVSTDRWRLRTGASAITSGTTSTFTIPSAKDFNSTGIRQVIFGCRNHAPIDNYIYWLNNLKIELGNAGGSWMTLYDPTSSEFGPVIIDIATKEVENTVGEKSLQTFQYVAFPMDVVDRTTVTVADAVTKFRFTWVGPTTTFTSTAYADFAIYLIAGSGRIPGGATHAISYYNDHSRSESPSQIITNAQADTIKNVGGGGEWIYAAPDLGGHVVNDPRLYYDYDVYYLNPSQAEIDRATNTLRVYRQGPEEIDFILVDEVTIATVSAGPVWSFSSGTAGSVVVYHDVTADADRKSVLRAPDAFHKSIPRAKAMITANNRLYVGNVYDGAFYNRGDVWISELYNPFRFRTSVRKLTVDTEDNYSPVRTPIAGEEIRAFAKVSSDLLGIDSVHAFGKGHYTFEGSLPGELSKARFVSNHGVIGQWCVAEYQNDVIWVDPDRQVRRMQAGADSISTGKVDDKLLNATLTGASMKVWNDRLYLAYKPSGGSSYSNILVYDMRLGEWVEDELGEGDAAGLMLATLASVRGLWYFTDLGHIYQHEKEGVAGDGSADGVVVRLSSRLIRTDGTKGLHIERVGMMADTVDGTVDVTRTYWPNGCEGISYIDLNQEGNYALVWDADLSHTENTEGIGQFAQLALAAQIPGGTEIYQVFYELDSRAPVVETSAS